MTATGLVRRGVGNLGLVLGLGTAHGVGGRLLAGEHRAPIRVRLLSCSKLASADLFGQGDDDARGDAKLRRPVTRTDHLNCKNSVELRGF